VHDPDDATAVDFEEHLSRLVDLDVMPEAVPRAWDVRDLEAAPDGRRDPASSREAVHLLKATTASMVSYE
jgi:hypothetical protein